MLLNTPICNFDWAAPDFTLADPNGQTYTMSECLGEKGLLIAFICNHCPYVKAITERLTQDTNLLMSEGIRVLAIMSNDYKNYPEDAPKQMIQFAKESGFQFPYLVDEDQSVGKQYGAVCTPDFFGFNSEGKLQYRGRLDDAKMEDKPNRKTELLDAMRLIARTGKGPEIQQASMGCSIKWTESA